jgi:branched-chain amino acid transport system ATP-binding protein
MEAERRVKLQIENLTLRFGGVVALSDVSLNVRDKEILAVIGPNGAGKTALLNCISGFYKPQGGQIAYEGKKNYAHASGHKDKSKIKGSHLDY